jgi:hypothetical protein
MIFSAVRDKERVKFVDTNREFLRKLKPPEERE